jgi:hypothetical protein
VFFCFFFCLSFHFLVFVGVFLGISSQDSGGFGVLSSIRLVVVGGNVEVTQQVMYVDI